jgi:membrane fusion protein (multidrug efflux system)
MKTAVKILALLFLVSCGGNNPEALKKKIDRKKTIVSKIEGQIADLESELAKIDTTDKVNARLVGIEKLEREPFSHYIEVQGALDGDNNVAVYPEAMGVIEEINAHVGQHVEKGQILARMNDAAVRDQIKGLETGLELATTVYEKQKSLWDQNIGSEVQYLQAKNAKETLESQLAAAKQQLGMMHIKSPISGTVEESNVKIGQTGSPQLPAFRVLNFGHLKVVTEVAEAYASKIKPGDEILVYLPDIGKEYHARVSFASNYIDKTNRTFRVEAILRESDPNMKANMVAVLKINDYRNEEAMILPVNYVQTDQKGSFVYVAEKGNPDYKAEKRRVSVGQIYNGLAEITKGLQSGDTIITQGYLDVKDGEYVRW